jgi:hypothetical protein
MLADLGQAMVPFAVAYVWLRLYDLATRGQLGALFALDLFSVMALLEFALVMVATFILLSDARRAVWITCSGQRCCSCSREASIDSTPISSRSARGPSGPTSRA